MPPATSPVHKWTTVGAIRPTAIPAELGEYIAHDALLLRQHSWHRLVACHHPLSDFSTLDNIHHAARRLLRHYKHGGVPVQFSTSPWTQQHIQHTLTRGPHQSAHDYIDFLQEEIMDMIAKGRWVVLPFSVIQILPGLHISPLGIVPQQGCHS
jgi:hypothetical protein